MNLSRIRPATVTLILAAGFIYLVGSRTENSGFELAGVILYVVAVIMAFNPATSRGDPADDESR